MGAVRIRLMIMVLSGLMAFCLTTPMESHILAVKPVDGVPGKIIAAPPKLPYGVMALSTHMAGLNERQDVLLFRDLKVDGASIPMRTWIRSLIILSNLPDDPAVRDNSSEYCCVAIAENNRFFTDWVLAIMSDMGGLLEAAATDLLGAPETDYVPDTFFLPSFGDNDV